MASPKIYWFTGQPGAGKTTLGRKLVLALRDRGFHVTHLDGDEIRTLTGNYDYSEAGRRANIERVQTLASKLKTDGMFVVVSLVSPYRDLRESFKARLPFSVREIYVHTTEKRGREVHHVPNYEPPLGRFVDIDTSGCKPDASFSYLLSHLRLPLMRYHRRGNGNGEYAMFVGRFQPWHAGHRWLIDQALRRGSKVVIAIRDVEVSQKNPFTSHQVHANISRQLSDLIDAGRVRVVIIPDIHSINFGRDVGYSLVEHFPPPPLSKISATTLRREIFAAGTA